MDAKFGGAYLNWGTSLAETGNFDDVRVLSTGCVLNFVLKLSLTLLDLLCYRWLDHPQAEPMFLKAVQCGGDVAPKAMLNLGLLYNTKSNQLAQGMFLADSYKKYPFSSSSLFHF